MAKLPVEFTEYTRQLMGDERFERYLQSFEEEPPVSIRLNPKKMNSQRHNLTKVREDGGWKFREDGEWKVEDAEPVPWCRNAYYLKSRPNFTFDPLFHAGCYYVQEAASMFLDELLRQVNHGDWNTDKSEPGDQGSPQAECGTQSIPRDSLDLCAAPGGKSTLLRAALPEDCVLYSNEPIRNRASILLENVTKWGYANHFVTNLYPEVYRKSKLCFDLILCDVPCSGEGMFRKDPATIGEWSPQQVEKCWRLQREIVDDAWACLNPGGLLIYSTCTFNTKENEENIRYFLEQYDAELVSVNIKPEWTITGSLLPGFNGPVYRFIPGLSRGEGLFICVLRKGSGSAVFTEKAECSHAGNKRFPRREQSIPTLGTIPLHVDNPRAELSYAQAIAYLRGEALRLPEDTPRGEVTVTFQGFPLGLVKNIGSRANNLYPKEWRIRTTHVPDTYQPVIEFRV